MYKSRKLRYEIQGFNFNRDGRPGLTPIESHKFQTKKRTMRWLRSQTADFIEVNLFRVSILKIFQYRNGRLRLLRNCRAIIDRNIK